ncbi:MAG: TRAP transporter substrate-binding protein [Methylocystaceae bacterium]
MKSKTLKAVALVLVMMFAVAIVGCGGKKEPAASGDKASTEKQVTIHLGTTVSPDHSYSRAVAEMAKDVETKSNGSIKILYEGAGVHGGEADEVQALQRGELQMMVASDIAIASVIPELGFTQLPFLFKDQADVDARYRNGWMGQRMTEVCATKGIQVLGFGENDWRGLTSGTRELKKGADFKGMKLRVPTTPMYVDFYKKLGTLPTAMAITEVATALQQKTVDGQDNGAIMTYTNGLNEFQKYMYNTRHMYSGALFIVSKTFFDSLSDNQKQILTDAAKAAADKQYQYNHEDVSKFFEAMKAKGLQVEDPTPQLMADMKVQADAMMKDPQYDKLYGKDVMDKIRTENGIK